MKRTILVSLLIMCIFLTGCRGRSGARKTAEEVADSTQVAQPADSSTVQQKEQPKDTIAADYEPVLDMVTSMGNIRIKLYKETPQHRDNFVKLARKGYYNGLLFHRVINGFMIQAGDPLTRDTTKVEMYGSGGPNYTIPAEIVPSLHHKKGAIAAARRGDSVNPQRASSGSQFYIVQDEQGCMHLDGEYTVFGEVVDGLSVVDNIAGVETNARGLPLYPIKIISVKEIK